jgi:hypothetical protein
MILDAQNLFFKDQALSNTTLTSDVIDYGEGEANDPPKLVADVSRDAGNGDIEVTLQTCDEPTFASPTVSFVKSSKTFTTSFSLAGYPGPLVSAPLPRGNKRYLRTSVKSTFTDGKMTVALVNDDDIPWNQK